MNAESNQSSTKKSKKGKKAYLILAAVTALAVLSYFSYLWLTSNEVNTDNAQLEAEVLPLASKVGGTLLRLHAQDNQNVKKGEVIAEIDPRDYEARVAQLQAELDAAKAQAESGTERQSSRNNTAQVASAKAGLAKAASELRKAEADLNRARKLKSEKAITDVEFEDNQNAFDKAKAAHEQANAQLKLAEDQHGFAEAKVKSAEAILQQAQLQLEYTKILAPRDGILSKLAVQEGQLIQPGQLITQLVDSEIFVIANFKETQVGRMRSAQVAKITIDAYPGYKFSGKIESLSAATGARFSLLPPDNASGNFVKVVQRVPVKIKLDALASNDVVLKAGLSADVTVMLK